MKFNMFIPTRILEVATRWKIVSPEFLYKAKAERFGVQYIGMNKKHKIALSQDPVSESSFGVKSGERVEGGILRVRERFGIDFMW